MQTSAKKKKKKSYAGHLCENDELSGGGCGLWRGCEAKKGLERMEDNPKQSQGVLKHLRLAKRNKENRVRVFSEIFYSHRVTK